ncbi:zinc finger CCCH domain-containing protein 14 isoform X2 [Pectinophora gossypiella]|uniref:zinc finger CCCH domain-containing protein 14 isoform X2 n=1 Tax=Pectinophora gossypiella TaxID=13191 RepID=UPI00214F1373|nr:zinc finger CCCH domain-containing protein 14 isoform X2 [Pectinophora gossypiella]
MDVVGSEIGQKMRSAIKAKLTELGCYVDDELPDYVMVMVANKRTRTQMEDDLQLFLGDNTELFVNWLHQVLKKLQEVTIAPLRETEKIKEKSKDKKLKDKKDKGKLKKTDNLKKAKKKDKEKEKLRKKEEKKSHKSKKKSKHHEMIRPNIPPLLMNIEKESEPSITDVFAGQILKNHGIIIDTPKEEKIEDKKPVVTELKRPMKPIIDPATIDSQPEPIEPTSIVISSPQNIDVESTAPKEDQIKEINEIEAKIQGLKQKLAEQLDSMSDDEDFLNIRTEAEELMNDFAEDVFQEISSQTPAVSTPPLITRKSPTPPPPKAPEPKEPEILPQIELKLPKRPVRERLGAREEKKAEVPPVKEKEKRTESPERFTPERDPDFWGKAPPAKNRFGDPPPEPRKTISVSEESDKSDGSTKKVSSKVSGARGGCASVVRVRPRPRVAPASSLLLRAVADAHKSLLNIPPKVDVEQPKVKRALVLPMRRCVEAQNIVIQVPADREAENRRDNREKDMRHKLDSMEKEKEEYVPAPLSKKINNSDYVPSRRIDRTASKKDDTLIIETINIHNTTVDKDKNTQFIVTMDGFNPNAFLAKKLKTEGILDDVQDKSKEAKSLKQAKSVLKIPDIEATKDTKDKDKNKDNVEDDSDNIRITVEKEDDLELPPNKADEKEVTEKSQEKPVEVTPKKRLSDTSEDSDTQVIIKREGKELDNKRKSSEEPKLLESPPVKKRKASPIVFDVKKEKVKDETVKTRERTESASSDNHVTVTTASNTHKYDSLPPLCAAERKPVWCRSFPLCRYGAACAFQHPRCRFLAGCTRRACPYDHAAGAPAAPAALPPTVASHVVPAANYKSISGSIPSVCKYYPNCVNPSCHFYHPKPCRYGKACVNKLECNFYHNDTPAKFRYPV